MLKIEVFSEGFYNSTAKPVLGCPYHYLSFTFRFHAAIPLERCNKV